jgi:hypothetical protein
MGKFESLRNRLLAMILVASMAWGGLSGCASAINSRAGLPPPSADCPEGDLDCVELRLREWGVPY